MTNQNSLDVVITLILEWRLHLKLAQVFSSLFHSYASIKFCGDNYTIKKYAPLDNPYYYSLPLENTVCARKNYFSH